MACYSFSMVLLTKRALNLTEVAEMEINLFLRTHC